MTAVPLDASLIEKAQVGAVLLEPPTVRIQMEITLWGRAEGGCEVRTRLGHAQAQCEIRASSNLLGTSKLKIDEVPPRPPGKQHAAEYRAQHRTFEQGPRSQVVEAGSQVWQCESEVALCEVESGA
jgi:hypothetical protein